jgi:hypothetical protein
MSKDDYWTKRRTIALTKTESKALWTLIQQSLVEAEKWGELVMSKSKKRILKRVAKKIREGWTS